MKKPRRGQLVSRIGDRSWPSRTPAITGSANVLINNRPAVRVGDLGSDGWVAVEGAPHVLLNGRPIHRITDKHSDSECCQGSWNTVCGDYPRSTAPSFESVGEGRIIKIHFKAFIPSTLHKKWADPPWFDSPDPTEPFVQYKGDDREFFKDGTSRLHSWAILYLSPNNQISLVLPGHYIGDTHRRYQMLIKDYNGLGKMVEYKDVKRAEKDMWEKSCSCGGYVVVQFYASVGMPFKPITAPNIDYNVEFFVIVLSGGSRPKLRVRVRGKHDLFPGYEAYVEDRAGIKPIWFYDPGQHDQWGPGLKNLNTSVDLGANAGNKECLPTIVGPKLCYASEEVVID